MWAAKVRFSERGTLIGSKAIKHKVNVFGFPLSYYYEKNCVIVHIAGILVGEKRNILQFTKELKKEKRVKDFELNGTFFIGTIKEPSYAKTLYNKDIIQLTPALISSQGYEIINIACFDKPPLIKAINTLEKNLAGELLCMKQEKIKTISITKMHPDLTEKQKHAINIAIRNGYYNVPRKTSLEKLAKLSKLSFSTFQVHIRKAEAKLLPYFFE